MMGHQDFPGPLASPSISQAARREEKGDKGDKTFMMGSKGLRFPGPPAATSGSQARKRETKGGYDGIHGLAISRN